MKPTLALAFGAMMLVPAAAQAQQAAPAAATAAPTVGATIFDSAGVSLGTVDSVTPQAIVINTGTAKVPVPPTSIGKTGKGFAMAMTKADLDAAVAGAQAQAQAAVKAKLVPGGSVSGINGSPVGTIKAADAQSVTITTAKGEAKLPVSAFSANASGQLIIGMTAADLEAQIAADSGGAAAAAPAK